MADRTISDTVATGGVFLALVSGLGAAYCWYTVYANDGASSADIAVAAPGLAAGVALVVLGLVTFAIGCSCHRIEVDRAAHPTEENP